MLTQIFKKMKPHSNKIIELRSIFEPKKVVKKSKYK